MAPLGPPLDGVGSKLVRQLLVSQSGRVQTNVEGAWTGGDQDVFFVPGHFNMDAAG